MFSIGSSSNLNEKLFDFDLDTIDLSLKVRILNSNDRTSNNRTGHTASTTKSNLGRNKDVRNVLIFTEERNVENNFERFSISSHNNKRGLSTVQSLGSYKSKKEEEKRTFIGSLFKLAVVSSLLNEIKDRSSKFRTSKRIGLGSIVILHKLFVSKEITYTHT